MKKILLVLPFVFFLSSCSKKTYSINDLSFNLRFDNTYEVSLKEGSKSKKIEIPSIYENKNVTKIAYLNANSYVNEIVIPESVKEIEEGAFNFCENLNTLTVSKKNEYYTSIDGNLYSKDKTKLIIYSPGKEKNNVTLKNIKEIAPYAFTNVTKLQTLTIDSSIIDTNAFYNCLNLKGIYFNNLNVEFKDKVFKLDNSLEKVYINIDAKVIDNDNLIKTKLTETKDIKYQIYEVK